GRGSARSPGGHGQVAHVLRVAFSQGRARRARGDVVMPAGCAPYRMALGAYVLGALDPGERADVEAHVADCHECREELSELAVLPGLLGRLNAAEVADLGTPAPAAPPELLERMLATAAAEQRTRRRWRM